MDPRFQQALDFANYQNTFSTQKRILKEKLEAKLIYGYGGGIFKIDNSLLTFVQMLVDNDKIENVPILDKEGNPVMVENMTEFKDAVFSRYFDATNEYVFSFNDLKAKRSVEKIVSA